MYTISVYTALGERLGFLGAIRHELLLGFALSAICVFVVVQNPLLINEYRLILVGMVLLFGVMLSQIPFALDQTKAWPTFYNYVFKQALFGFFLAALIRTPQHLRWFIVAFLFSLFWVYQEAVQGLITGALVWWNQGIMRLHGAVTIYAHANGISRIAVTCLPFLIFLFPVVSKKRYKLILLVIGGLAIPCILYSGSRAGYVGTLAIFLIWWLMIPYKKQGILAGIVLGAILLVVMPQEYKDRFLSIGGEEAAGHSKEARLMIVSDALEIFQENPLGVGLNSFVKLRIQKFGRHQDTHNLWLQVATHLGVQGLAIFCFFLYTLIHAYHRVNRRMIRLAEQVRRFPHWSDERLPRRCRMTTFLQDIAYTRAISRAVLMYLLMLMMNGLFAHSLYLIDWWFCSGLAICLLNITAQLEGEFKRAVKGADPEAAGP